MDDESALDPEKHSQAVIEKRNKKLEMKKKFEAQQFAKEQLALKAKPSPYGKITIAIEVLERDRRPGQHGLPCAWRLRLIKATDVSTGDRKHDESGGSWTPTPW